MNKKMINKKNYKNYSFWSRNPMTYVDFKKNIFERLPKTKKEFTRINKELVRSNPDFLEIISRLNKKIKNKIILDLGMGFGSSSIILSKYAKKVFSIDLTKIATTNAKRNIKINKIKNVSIRQMDAEQLSFNNDSFDFIFSWGVIHHSNNPEIILKKMKQKLKKNGASFIMVYNFYSFRYIFLSLYHLFIKGHFFRGYNFTTIGKKFTDGYYNKHYRSSEMKKLLKKIGYKNIKISVGHHKGRIIPFVKSHDSYLARFLSRYYGYFLYAYFEK